MLVTMYSSAHCPVEILVGLQLNPRREGVSEHGKYIRQDVNTFSALLLLYSLIPIHLDFLNNSNRKTRSVIEVSRLGWKDEDLSGSCDLYVH